MITLTVLLQNRKKAEVEQAAKLASTGKWCAENAFYTIDGISFFPSYDISRKPYVFAVNNNRTSNKIIYRIEDDTVIQSSMSEYSLEKFKKGLKNNKNRLIAETREASLHA